MLVLLVSSVLALVVGPPAEQGRAALPNDPSRSSAAQVRIFQNGELRGGGTLVARNWVLTAAHLFDRPDGTGYSLRFGEVNNQADTDQTNLRSIDQIVMHPDLVDLAMVHFSDPVPAGTWIPRLANRAPGVLDWAHMYGWGSNPGVLTRHAAFVHTPKATQNAAFLRANDAYFDAVFRDFDPMVTRATISLLDEGSGTFVPRGVLAGVAFGNGLYREEDDFSATEPPFISTYEIPVWEFLPWINSVINGEGTSGSQNDELRRRRLTEIPPSPTLPAGDALPMTRPPQVDVCDEEQPQCTSPDPTWQAAILVGYSQHQGIVPARCAETDGNTCTFDGVSYAGGATAQLPLGAVGVTGIRQVMIWCRSTASLNVGDPPQPVLEVSFTNTEYPRAPVGMGWWLVIPDQVTIDTTAPVDTTPFATC